jgi:hypothetical protein
MAVMAAGAEALLSMDSGCGPQGKSGVKETVFFGLLP